MSKSNWTFTSYENGKPVAIQADLNHEQAVAAIRAAMSGAPVADELSARRDPVARQETRELAHAA